MDEHPITTDEIVEVLQAVGITKPKFLKLMTRLGAIDTLNQLRSKRELLRREQAEEAAAAGAALAALENQIASVQSSVDEVVGG